MLNDPDGSGFYGAAGFNGDIQVAQNHGFRAFRYNLDDTLTSLVYDYEWVDGVNRAVCATTPNWDKPARSCPFPNKRCSHGFYAYYGEDYYPVSDEEDGVVVHGIIDGFGRCVIGDKGYRSEYATLVAFLRPQQNGSRVTAADVCAALERKYPTVPIFDNVLELKAAIPLPGRPPRNGE